MGKVYTVKQVAKKLNTSRNTIYGMIEKGKLKKINDTGRIIRIPEDEINNFIANIDTSPSLEHDPNKVIICETHIGKIRKLKNEDWYVLKDLSRNLKQNDTYTIKRRVSKNTIKLISLEEANCFGMRTNCAGLLLITYEGIKEYSAKARNLINWNKLLSELNREVPVIKEDYTSTSGIAVIDQREVLGKDFKIYGDFDNPLFLAKDVAVWIDYSKSGNGSYNVHQMLSTIDEEEKQVLAMLVAGQNREVTFLTEDGLYEVLMQSRKPIAKEFKKKVKEILKQIRLKGGYVNNSIKFVDNYFESFSTEMRKQMVAELGAKIDQLFIEKDKVDNQLMANIEIKKKIEKSLSN